MSRAIKVRDAILTEMYLCVKFLDGSGDLPHINIPDKDKHGMSYKIRNGKILTYK